MRPSVVRRCMSGAVTPYGARFAWGWRLRTADGYILFHVLRFMGFPDCGCYHVHYSIVSSRGHLVCYFFAYSYFEWQDLWMETLLFSAERLTLKVLQCISFTGQSDGSFQLKTWEMPGVSVWVKVKSHFYSYIYVLCRCSALWSGGRYCQSILTIS